MNESLSLKGNLKITVFDSEGKVKEELHHKNLVVNSGKSFVGIALVNLSTAPFSYIGVGTGTTPASASDVALQNEIAREAFTYSLTPTTVTLTTIFEQGIGTGTITEAGIFNLNAQGIMFSRSVFAPITKSPSDAMQIEWTITLS